MTVGAARRVGTTVGAAEAGHRLDLWLAAQLPDLSRTRIKALVDGGRVSVNGAACKAARRLKAGERVEVVIPPNAQEEMVPEAIPLAIVFEDAHLLVVDKPAGMVTHPGAGRSTGTLAAAALAHAPEIAGVGGPRRPGIVHRLDKGTSGLIVLAKTRRAYDALTAQLQQRTMSRRYLCLAHGAIAPHDGMIDAPIARDPRSRVRMAVARAGTGKRALTRFRVLERFGGYTYLECRLETGRTHQIRVHLASLGHPLVGDLTYGAKPARQQDTLPADLVEGLGGVALHAAGLTFLHPATGEAVELSCPLPNRIARLLSHLSPFDPHLHPQHASWHVDRGR
jgi:23S rRNA pseudouridine1911/1915/1917 synthase